MKKRTQKPVMLMLLAGALALTLCGCVKETEAPDNTGMEDTADEESAEDTGTQKPEEASVLGDVQEIGEGQFVISEVFEEELEDGALMATLVTNEDEMNLITVFYDEDTVFYKRTIKDGGASYEDSKSAAKELVKGATVKLWGGYEGESFHASDVQIVEVL